MSPRPVARSAALVAVPASLVTSLLLLPAAAVADQPAGEVWGDAEAFFTPLYVALVFVGGPLALFLLITVLGSLGTHRRYPRPVLGEEAQLEAAEQHGEALRRSTGLGDEQEPESRG